LNQSSKGKSPMAEIEEGRKFEKIALDYLKQN